MSINKNDKVMVNKEINRKEGLYAVKGEVGEVIEVFYPETKVPHAKVLIEGKIKTFRLTSLDKIKNKKAPTG